MAECHDTIISRTCIFLDSLGEDLWSIHRKADERKGLNSRKYITLCAESLLLTGQLQYLLQ